MKKKQSASTKQKKIIKRKPRTKKGAAKKGVLLKKRKSVKKKTNPVRSRDTLRDLAASNGARKQARKRRPARPPRLPSGMSGAASPVILVRSEQNPIISPKAENGWEAWQTFNPGVVLIDDKIHFLYRAVGTDGVSRLGYAVSSDGFIIDKRLSSPVYEHKTGKQTFNIYSFLSGGGWGGSEDPRLVQIDGEDVLYMTYTACDNGLRVGLTSIKVDDFLNNEWEWRPPALISHPNETHKNWLIFPEKINGKYAILHSIKPNIQIEYVNSLEFDDTDYIESLWGGSQRKNCWDKWLRGAGAPPIKTRDGWLLFYHAMDNDWSKYKVGAMLLDLKDPTKILHRSKVPVLTPEEHYENNGYKPGVVYVSGAVVKDGNLLVYYGGADTFVCAATAPINEFLEDLRKNREPRLRQLKIKSRINV